jgi:hypothetical protein
MFSELKSISMFMFIFMYMFTFMLECQTFRHFYDAVIGPVPE